MPPLNDPPSLDLAAIRTRLENKQGPEYWRSLEELAETPEFQDYVRHEFPADAEMWLEPMSRRTLLKLMGASIGFALLAGCQKPLEKIIPYNRAPEDIIPGKPLFFASALPFRGYARGVLVETQMGRPTKIEGNPQHPDSLGATDALMQAAVLSLYDPDRSQAVTKQGRISTWNAFSSAFGSALETQKEKRGAGLRVLTETVTSPSLGAAIEELLRRFPEARWHQFDPVSRDAVRAGAILAFGRALETRYDLSRADVVVSLDADLFFDQPGSLRYARQWSARRREASMGKMNRLYVAEPSPTITGTMADHRLPARHSAIESFARRLAAQCGVPNVHAANGNLLAREEQWIQAAARELQNHRGAGLVIPGETQPAIVHALAHAINASLGNAGRTVIYTEPVEFKPVDHAASIQELAADMRAGKVDALLILGGNPVHTAPADLGFADSLSKVGLSAHLSQYDDETSELCTWHLPEAHSLETWGDLRASDGSVTIHQPQIQPLYGGRSAIETISLVVDEMPRSGHDLVHDYWKSRTRVLDFESLWRKSLHDGIMANTTAAEQRVGVKAGFAREPQAAEGGAIELIFKPDPSVWDGRYANNGWLQELPRPMSKLTWDNAALVSPAMAQRLGLSDGDMIQLRADGRTLDVPALITPGQSESSIAITLGYGRTRAGNVGNNVGFNSYALRTSNKMWSVQDAAVRKTGKRYALATTQHHFAMEGRDVVRAATLAEFTRDPSFAKEREKAPGPKDTLFTYSLPKKSEDYAWGMAIDLNTCIGCNACVAACQAENNIPVVGKDQVARGREMHWIRIDRYYKGSLDAPESYNQPVPCMHCENAPCEVVCPVGATTHSDEGLNQMVYNRCIGTRYCSNNCPYKVRRFNFFNYTKNVTGPLKLLQNPDVTVRGRGVMEKCTFCVQRIQEAKITADKESRTVRDGEIVPACAQACPTEAIVFGNIKDPKSRVTRMKSDPRDYSLLAELGTRPRTTYQARIKNPNPDVPEA